MTATLDGSGVPSGEPQGEGPSADPGEGVELVEPGKISSIESLNGSCIYRSKGQFAGEDKLLEPCSRKGIDIVIEDAHTSSAS